MLLEKTSLVLSKRQGQRTWNCGCAGKRWKFAGSKNICLGKGKMRLPKVLLCGKIGARGLKIPLFL